MMREYQISVQSSAADFHFDVQYPSVDVANLKFWPPTTYSLNLKAFDEILHLVLIFNDSACTIAFMKSYIWFNFMMLRA